MLSEQPKLPGSRVPHSLEDSLVYMEREASVMARTAGNIVDSFFGKPMQVEYKDNAKSHPVTEADRASQAYLTDRISWKFPGHGILGEESPELGQSMMSSDFLWVLDPLDGTTNFMSGFPIYAVSIGVLYRGVPVVGALYIPWPRRSEGMVLHARIGGGAFEDGQRLSLDDCVHPVAGRLVAIPGSMNGNYGFRNITHEKVGQIRVSGSIAYELAMIARGVMRYTIVAGPKLWDVAGGVLLVSEAGGSVMIRQRRHWKPMYDLVSSWGDRQATDKELRQWVCPMVAGDAQAVPFIAANLRRNKSGYIHEARSWMCRRLRMMGMNK
jgi:myo-inositol-1(or 4)-monophosphatase